MNKHKILIENSTNNEKQGDSETTRIGYGLTFCQRAFIEYKIRAIMA